MVFFQGLSGLARSLPRRTGLRVFSAIGRTAGWMLRKDRERALDNLAIAFPDMPHQMREALTRAMFKNMGHNLYEFLNLGGSPRDRVLSLVERVDGVKHFEEAYHSGRGVIGVTGHIGCWELLTAYFAQRGFEINVIGRELWEKRLNKRLVAIRQSVGYRTIDRDTGGREALRILKNGGMIAALIDQHTRVDGIYVPFFNKPAHTPTGVARMAMATGADIVPMAIYTTKPGKHMIRVMPALERPGTADKDEAVEQLTKQCSQAIEELIRHDPKQWVWFHRRWREPERARVSYAAVN